MLCFINAVLNVIEPFTNTTLVIGIFRLIEGFLKSQIIGLVFLYYLYRICSMMKFISKWWFISLIIFHVVYSVTLLTMFSLVLAESEYLKSIGWNEMCITELFTVKPFYVLFYFTIFAIVISLVRRKIEKHEEMNMQIDE